MKTVLLVLSLFAGAIVFGQGEDIRVKKQAELHILTLYHSNGTIAQQGHVTKDNKLHGTWVSFDEEGNKKAIGHYLKGKKVGTWFFYKPDSKFVTQVDYNENHTIAGVHQLVYKYQVAETEVD